MDENAGPDIEVEITNGKTVKINLSPVEWAIVSVAVIVLSSAAGYVL